MISDTVDIHAVAQNSVSDIGRPVFREHSKLKPGETMVLWISRIIIWVVIVATLLPIYFVVMAALNPTNAFMTTGFFPPVISLANFKQLFSDGQFVIWVRNSTVVGLCVAAAQVFFTATSAYAFSRLRFYGRKYGLLTLLVLQMFPQILSISAIYGLLSRFNLIDSLSTYILVMLGGSAYNIWLLKGYLDTLPRELDEAALIDGANSWQRFIKVLLPLSIPMLVVIFILTLFGVFSEYILAGTILQSPQNYTLGVGIYGMINQQFAKNWGEFAAASVLSSIPLALIFAFCQRWIASGLVAGSVKG